MLAALPAPLVETAADPFLASYGFVTMFYISFVLSSIVTTTLGKVYLYVHVLWFHVLLPLGDGGGLRSFIVALPGDIFIVFIYRYNLT